MKNSDIHRGFSCCIKKLAILSVCIAFFFCSCSTSNTIDTPYNAPSIDSTTVRYENSHFYRETNTEIDQKIQCKFFDADLFNKQIRTCIEYNISAPVRAAVIPHHSPHMDMVCSLLSSDGVQLSDYDTIIVVGPNHSGEGTAIQITGKGFSWNGGEVEGDLESAHIFLNDFRFVSSADTLTFSEDHSVSVLMPYLSYYIPDVPVVGVLLSSGTKIEELNAFCEDLISLSEKGNILILFSIDFSHYQLPTNAEQYDTESKKIFLEGDPEYVLTFDNEHLDSPPSAFLFLKYLQIMDLNISLEDYRLSRFIENGEVQAMSYFVFTAHDFDG